jgi:hypothetical protein
LPNIAAVTTLIMRTAIAETFQNLQQSMCLIPESQSYMYFCLPEKGSTKLNIKVQESKKLHKDTKRPTYFVKYQITFQIKAE